MNIEKISRVISKIDIRKECCLKTTATIIGLALFASVAMAKEATTELKVPAMDCAACTRRESAIISRPTRAALEPDDKMIRKFDVVVIGTGSAASTVAALCGKAGRSVAVIDSRPFGGTCALRGCDPKKVLVGVAEVIDWNRRMQGKGVRAQESCIDWPELMRFKRTFTESRPKQTEQWMTKSGIATFHDRARFVGPVAIQVGRDVLEAANVVVAAGAKPVDLNIPGAEHAITSEQFLELDNLAGRIVFIGGGYISFEFTHVAARAGSHVTILHRGDRPLASLAALYAVVTRPALAARRLPSSEWLVQERLLLYLPCPR